MKTQSKLKSTSRGGGADNDKLSTVIERLSRFYTAPCNLVICKSTWDTEINRCSPISFPYFRFIATITDGWLGIGTHLAVELEYRGKLPKMSPCTALPHQLVLFSLGFVVSCKRCVVDENTGEISSLGEDIEADGGARAGPQKVIITTYQIAGLDTWDQDPVSTFDFGREFPRVPLSSFVMNNFHFSREHVPAKLLLNRDCTTIRLANPHWTHLAETTVMSVVSPKSVVATVALSIAAQWDDTKALVHGQIPTGSGIEGDVKGGLGTWEFDRVLSLSQRNTKSLLYDLLNHQTWGGADGRLFVKHTWPSVLKKLSRLSTKEFIIKLIGEWYPSYVHNAKAEGREQAEIGKNKANPARSPTDFCPRTPICAIVGPSGCGKTLLVQRLKEAVQLGDAQLLPRATSGTDTCSLLVREVSSAQRRYNGSPPRPNHAIASHYFTGEELCRGMLLLRDKNNNNLTDEVCLSSVMTPSKLMNDGKEALLRGGLMAAGSIRKGSEDDDVESDSRPMINGCIVLDTPGHLIFGPSEEPTTDEGGKEKRHKDRKQVEEQAVPHHHHHHHYYTQANAVFHANIGIIVVDVQKFTDEMKAETKLLITQFVDQQTPFVFALNNIYDGKRKTEASPFASSSCSSHLASKGITSALPEDLRDGFGWKWDAIRTFLNEAVSSAYKMKEQISGGVSQFHAGPTVELFYRDLYFFEKGLLRMPIPAVPICAIDGSGTRELCLLALSHLARSHRPTPQNSDSYVQESFPPASITVIDSYPPPKGHTGIVIESILSYGAVITVGDTVRVVARAGVHKSGEPQSVPAVIVTVDSIEVLAALDSFNVSNFVETAAMAFDPESIPSSVVARLRVSGNGIQHGVVCGSAVEFVLPSDERDNDEKISTVSFPSNAHAGALHACNMAFKLDRKKRQARRAEAVHSYKESPASEIGVTALCPTAGALDSVVRFVNRQNIPIVRAELAGGELAHTVALGSSDFIPLVLKSRALILILGSYRVDQSISKKMKVEYKHIRVCSFSDVSELIISLPQLFSWLRGETTSAEEETATKPDPISETPQAARSTGSAAVGFVSSSIVEDTSPLPCKSKLIYPSIVNVQSCIHDDADDGQLTLLVTVTEGALHLGTPLLLYRHDEAVCVPVGTVTRITHKDAPPIDVASNPSYAYTIVVAKDVATEPTPIMGLFDHEESAELFAAITEESVREVMLIPPSSALSPSDEDVALFVKLGARRTNDRIGEGHVNKEGNWVALRPPFSKSFWKSVPNRDRVLSACAKPPKEKIKRSKLKFTNKDGS